MFAPLRFQTLLNRLDAIYGPGAVVWKEFDFGTQIGIAVRHKNRRCALRFDVSIVVGPGLLDAAIQWFKHQFRTGITVGPKQILEYSEADLDYKYVTLPA